ncbi:ATP/DNA binding protein [Thalictrum thalictroides]|uniref:ATP/DNA binding protein n=1 Tax=Thalictrum thalictroides TaxID=46969 RepID=A0A7J6W8Q1_THATH|nr:ATP/DNA binding protein [Thalictrum thalictroides]
MGGGNPALADIQKIYGSTESLPATTIVLPLKPDKEQVVKSQLSSIHPEVLLFLSKIRRLSVREDNTDPRLNTINAISISSETDFTSRKNVDAESYTLHLSAEEDCADNERECNYYMWRQKFPVSQGSRVERRMEIDDLVITLAFPNGSRLNRGMDSPGIYEFPPTEMVTNFPFIVQADFVLASSRETIVLHKKWNLGILACVPSAFVNAFNSLVKTSGAALVSSLSRMFEFLPVDSSSYPILNTGRDSIRDKLSRENIVPSESYTEQKKFFHKPNEVGRIKPTFWDILNKARKHGVSLHHLSSHGIYALSSAFEKEYYDDILNFLEVRSMTVGAYKYEGNSIVQICWSRWACALGTINEVTNWNGKSICISYNGDHVSWLIDWNKEFRCSACFFMPQSTQEALWSFRGAETLYNWLVETGEACYVDVNDYAILLIITQQRQKACCGLCSLSMSVLNKEICYSK